MKSFKIAGVQYHAEYGSKEKNLNTINTLAEEAKQNRAEFVLFPELSISGFIVNEEVSTLAEPVPGPSTHTLEKTAARLNIVLCAGLIEKDRGLNYNTTVIVSPGGPIGKYRKVHLPFIEYPWYSSGGRFPLVDTEFCRVGISTCCDNLFSEQTRILAIQGAEVILSPFCWLYEKEDSNPIKPDEEPDPTTVKNWVKGHLKRIMPAKAYENGVYLLAANQYGWIGQTGYFASGGVMLFGPDGEIVSQDSTSCSHNEIVVGDVEEQKINEWRSRGNFSLKLRHPELYNRIIEKR